MLLRMRLQNEWPYKYLNLSLMLWKAMFVTSEVRDQTYSKERIFSTYVRTAEKLELKMKSLICISLV